LKIIFNLNNFSNKKIAIKRAWTKSEGKRKLRAAINFVRRSYMQIELKREMKGKKENPTSVAPLVKEEDTETNQMM